MPTRVSSFAQTQLLIQSMLRNQTRVAEDQLQIATGKKAQDFGGMGGDTITSLGARAFQERVETFRRVIGRVESRLEANDVQLGGIIEGATDFRQEILSIIAQDQAAAFSELLGDTFSFIASSLNTEIAGQFIFAGSNTDVAPIVSGDINDLIAAAQASDMFTNDDTPQRASVSDAVEVEYGLLADDMALPLFESFKRIAEFHNGPGGPIDGKLTTAQRDFLINELQLLDQAIDNTRQVQVRNGLRQQRIETIAEQHVETSDFLQVLVSEVEDVNVAEAISRLNLDQTALEASFRTFGTLSDLTLLDFI